jgi:hypothetical protein
MTNTFTVYLAVHTADMASCTAAGEVERRHVGNRSYIGLRVTPEDALVRARQGSWGVVDKHTYTMLQICFTAAGFLHYATLPGGPQDHFAPVLSKKVYHKGEEQDWNVWHFNMDLPLRAHGPNGELWISTTWYVIS